MGERQMARVAGGDAEALAPAAPAASMSLTPHRAAGRPGGTIGPAAGVTQSRTLDGAEQMVRDYTESVWQDQRVGILSRVAAECGAVRHLTPYAERRGGSRR